MENNTIKQLEIILKKQTKFFDREEFLRDIRTLTSNLEHELVEFPKTYSFKEIIDKNLNNILNPFLNNSIFIPTGFNNLDKFIGGFSFGELVVLGARPGMGKTQLLVNLCLNICQNVGVAFISLDLSEQSLLKRFISCITHIPQQNLNPNTLKENEIASIKLITSKIAKQNIIIQTSPIFRLDLFINSCRKLCNEKNIRVFIIDYLQLINVGNRWQNRDAELSVVMHKLKKLAIELNVIFILSSQLSRNVENRGGDLMPKLSDLSESGSIEQDADKVLFIYRPEYYRLLSDEYGNPAELLAKIIIAKNRSGKIGDISLKRDEQFTFFTDWDKIPDSFIIPENRHGDIR